MFVRCCLYLTRGLVEIGAEGVYKAMKYYIWRPGCRVWLGVGWVGRPYHSKVFATPESMPSGRSAIIDGLSSFIATSGNTTCTVQLREEKKTKVLKSAAARGRVATGEKGACRAGRTFGCYPPAGSDSAGPRTLVYHRACSLTVHQRLRPCCESGRVFAR